MRQVPLDIVAGSYADETRPFSSQDTVNYLPVFAEQGGTRTPTMLKTPPGLRPFVHVWATPPAEGSPGVEIGPVRRTHNCEGKLFAVMGQTLYQVTPAGVAIPQGTVPGIGRCSMAHNQLATGNQLVTVNGTSGYCFNTQSQVFERITDEGFPGAIKVIFMDGYIIGIEPRRRFAFNSEVANALAYNTLDRFTSEYLPDLLVSLESVQNQLVLFSEGSMEFFENTGATEQPFRSKRISQKRGCAGTFTTAVIDQTVYWLGDDGIFYRLEGYAPKRISTRPIEQAIRGLDWKNAFAETWTDAGHLVVYWTFPDGLTWGYDISSGQWHRRQSYGFNRWRPNTLTYINNEWVAGDFQNGRLWKLDWDYVLEGDDEIISERVTQTLADNQNRMLVSRLELIVDTGQPVTEPIEFPDQPEGPSISGSAPDCLVDVATTPFQYTISGNAPLKVTLRSGTLPPGLSISQAGVRSGTPTEEGSYTYTLRVTDKYGLWADHTDTVQIRAYLYDFVAAASTGSYFGSTAETWTASSVNGNGRPMTWGRRIILLRPSGNVVSDDYLATVTPKAAPWSGSATLARPTKTANGRIYVAAGDTNLYYTDDGAETWTTVALGFTVAKLAGDDDVLIVYTDTNHYRVAVGGLTFGSQKSAPANIQDIGYGDGMFMFATASANYYWSEDNGTTLTPVSIPAPGGDTLENYSNFRTKGGAWLAINRVNGNNTNETIARSPDGKQPFVYVTTPSGNMDGGSSNAFAQRGDKIVCPLQFNLTTEFFIAVSGDDGVTWTRHDHGYPGASDFPSSGVVAFPEEGAK